MTEDTPTRSTAIVEAACERAADVTGVSESDLTTAINIVDAELTDEHSDYENDYDYETVEGIRIYAADDAAWADLAERLDLSGELREGVRVAHNIQADRTLGEEALLEDAAPIVTEIKTAEDMPTG
jgi:hypothetical protein